ncbi:MAG: hypothetical protein HEP71_23605 [Roseivirga sp.]|nr:hypothetical protein [Roseivirga sp.]
MSKRYTKASSEQIIPVGPERLKAIYTIHYGAIYYTKLAKIVNKKGREKMD